MSIIQKRRSIRRFLEQSVEVEKIHMLVEAALCAPSSRGINPWEFIVVTEKGLLEKLSKAKQSGSEFLQNAPLGIVVCANPDKGDTWIEDSSIASIFILLAAESMGLGGCWIHIRNRMHDDTKTAQAYIGEILGIPERLTVESIIALGYPDEKKSPHTKGELQYEKVYFNSYGESYTI